MGIGRFVTLPFEGVQVMGDRRHSAHCWGARFDDVGRCLAASIPGEAGADKGTTDCIPELNPDFDQWMQDSRNL